MLFRSVAGILPFDAGDILINGISIKKDPVACKKQIAYIPDNPDLYDSLTGIQYLNFIANVFLVDEKTREERIRKYSDLFELTSELNNYVGSYSHGMKQKLAIISAFLHDPKLLILDEPFVGLDPAASFTIKKIMKEFCEAGGAIFFSTHVLEVAQKICNKIAIIKGGKLIREGLMSELTKDESLEDVFMELIDHATN